MDNALRTDPPLPTGQHPPTSTPAGSTPRPRSRPSPTKALWPLSRGWRRAALVTHIVSAGTWIGIEVIVAVLILVGWFGGDVEVRSLAYRALATFIVWPLLGAGLVCLATGLVLGLATKWGLLRYWWVAVKLVANLILCALIPISLQPGMDEVATYGGDLLAGDPDRPAAIATLFFPPAVSLITLVVAVTLAAVKPWGRIRSVFGVGSRRDVA